MSNLKYKTIINADSLLDYLLNTSLLEVSRLNPAISFDKDNNPLSYWHDKKWDYSQDKVNVKKKICVLDFEKNYSKINDKLLQEFKYFILIIFLSYYKNNRDIKYFKSIMAKAYPIFIAVKNSGHNSTLVMNEEIGFHSVMTFIKNKYTFRTMKNILSTLKSFSEIIKPNFNLHLNWNKQNGLNTYIINSNNMALKYCKTQSKYVEQTLYIPNKIHSKLVSECLNIINNQKKELPKLFSYLEKNSICIKKEKHEHLKEQSILEIKNEIRTLIMSCIVLILSFSGMRSNELKNIKEDGFKIINSEPKLYVIRSYETKISGGQIADYITSPIIKDVFEVLQKINKFIKKHDSSIILEDLFITSENLKLNYCGLSKIGSQLNYLSKEFNLKIDYEDVKESELLNGPRKEIQVGNIWPLASHQFRRTLIVNFVAHRLGTINAVKQQVKHMYATMTEYYAKNSMLSETFNLNVVKEISESIEDELLNEGVRQYKDFYYSEEPLAGMKGEEILEERQNVKILSDNEIKQLFKTGLYKISKSMYGYCTKGNLCDKKEAIDPTFCGASCSTMIITKENADNWKKLYFRNKKLLEKDFSIGGVPMNAVTTTVKSQNEVAKSIMNKFNIKYED